jgi:hypothetical protein
VATGSTDERLEFSVYEIEYDDTTHPVKRFIGAKEAVEIASKCSRRACLPLSMVRRVIITDGGDHTVFEWQRHAGITYPTNYKGWFPKLNQREEP